jgi:hypothetical protein
MRALQAPVLAAAVLVLTAPASCGLDADGRLAVVDAGSDAEIAPGDDAAPPDTAGDADPLGEQAGDDAGNPSARDGGSEPRRDASTTKADAGPTPPRDAGADVVVFTCSSCAEAMCPTQLAACGTGSQCLAYRDCNVACGINGSSNCSTTCGTMYPSGQTAFAALTLCDLGCGAGCTAGLAAGTP